MNDMMATPDMGPHNPETQRRFCLLGTAGHIDHGKSALVEALTGTDPDRLPEEKARGMTIVLGFAKLEIAAEDGQSAPTQIGIVDVPGHERFVKTMVAGASGVDLGLLVVAADDGVMPQTREHVEILDLLGVERGAVAITKADVAHADRIPEVKAEIADLVRFTVLKDWPVVVTSAKSGQGLDEIRSVIRGLVGALPPLEESSIFRLAVDRVFSIHGRGTVVTGSVLSGKVAPAAALELQPSGQLCKVREVQSHGEVVTDAAGGQRAALNVTGLDRGRIERGMDLATPGYLTCSRYVDARIRILLRQEKPFRTHRNVRVSMGTRETMARLVVIGADRIEPGDEALIQLHFFEPVVAAFRQRFILRSESAQTTVGGGHVVRPISRRVRPLHAETMEEFQRAESPDAFLRFAEAVRRAGFEEWKAERLACEVGIEPGHVEEFRQRLEDEKTLITIGGRRVHQATVEAIERRALAYLKRHHANKPSEPGWSKDRFVGWIETRTAAGLGRSVLERLETRKLVIIQGPYVAHHEFRPALSGEDAAQMTQLVDEIKAAGLDPPEWKKLKTIQPLSRQRAKVLEGLAKIEPALVSFGPQRYISADAMERFKHTVRELGTGDRKFKLADVRDALQLSRRVVQPLLEHLDRVQFTKRVGDERILLD
ncbi:MAG: selenocysteine-specific translation elongation factor [Phycisphaerales bacterium]|nr:selenocysteine-specific translation elongation factor [Phycisphaerales bacterium]